MDVKISKAGLGSGTSLWVSEVPAGEDVTGFALVLFKEERVTREGASYLSLTLGDRLGQVNAKLWDSSSQDFTGIEQYSLVKIRGTMGQWQGQKQLRIQKIRLARASDSVAPEDFVAAAPERGEEMLAYVHETVEDLGHPHIRALLQKVLWEHQEKLLIAPAASRNHHAVRSGLLYHIKTMLRAGLSLLPVYPFLNKDLLVAGIILHDMSKLEELEIDPLGVASHYSVEGNLLGHLVMGVTQIDRVSREVGMDRETALLLEHMILSHHYEPEFGSPKRPAFPEAELLHYLDILDARLYDMNQVMADMSPGSCSDRVWRLESRRLYRPKGL
ncbi:MAG: CMP-binding protein [Peptococcaceae bacterium]|nr:CMP-binding protein [Peptococcaceae bacterium]